MDIYYSPQFARHYKKLPSPTKKIAEKQVLRFRINPFDPLLKTHHLTGKLKRYWSFSIDYHYRIIFEFINTNTVHFHAVGTHDQVY